MPMSTQAKSRQIRQSRTSLASARGPEALHVPGLWQTELAMQGPEQLQFMVEPATSD
jgi:hypothetical protein